MQTDFSECGQMQLAAVLCVCTLRLYFASVLLYFAHLGWAANMVKIAVNVWDSEPLLLYYGVTIFNKKMSFERNLY